MLVHSAIYDEFVTKFKNKVAQLKVGNPLSPSTDIGPLVSAEHLKKVTSCVDTAKRQGAKVFIS